MNTQNEQPYTPTGILLEACQPARSELRQKLEPLIQRLIPNPSPKQENRWAYYGDSGEQALLDDLAQAADELLARAQDSQRIPELEQTITAQAERIQQLDDQLLKTDVHLKIAEHIKDSLYDENFKMQERLEKMQAEVEMCRRFPIIRQPEFDPTLQTAQTPWMEAWRAAAGFQNQAMLIILLGDTGIGRQPLIREKMADLLNYKNPKAGNITKAITACEKRKLISIRQAKKGLNGRPPMLIELTEKGQAAYVMLTNKKPRMSELETISSHMSDQHMLLNLAVEEFLTQDGHEILSHGHRHYLDGVRQAVPDITTQKGGKTYYIEVECNGYKHDRDAKWVNMRDLSGGNLYVFCQSWNLATQITEEVEKTLDQFPEPYTLHIANLEDCKKHERLIWLALAQKLPEIPENGEKTIE
jgi:hypothetical protein